MLKTHMAACLVATAFLAVPALAQTTAPTGNRAPATSTVTPSKTAAAQFVTQAANSNMFEIQSSQLALNKTKDNRIQDFAQQMIKDHTEAGEKLKAAAQDQTVPTALDQEHAQMLQKLQQVSGNDFDRSYVQMQLDGHQKAVALFESYGQNGDNAQLKQFAEQTTPTLRQHLQHITDIHNSLLGPAPQVSQNQSGQTSGQFMTQIQSGQWLASKLEGLNVYNDNNDKVGDIRELLLDRSGKIQAVVVGVGGFLGVGERDVAVPFEQVRIVNEPRTTAATTNPNSSASTMPAAPNSPTTTGATTTAGRSTTDAMNRTTPDHALLSMTKDQLKAAPEFKSNR
jgi:Predicted outer membrane protein